MEMATVNRYSYLSKKIENEGRPVYLPYALLGYPDIAHTVEVCRTLIGNGADGLELGFPFSDPVADGPVILNAGNMAIDAGFKLDKGVELVREIRALNDAIPLTGMSYYNMISARGPERFISQFKDAGMDGILIPDMPPERAEEIAPIARDHDMAMIFIASPLSQTERLQNIARFSGGFVYVVTRLGITGVSAKYSDQLQRLFSDIRGHIPLPAIAGFGISEPDQAEEMVRSGADGVITGSRLVELITRGWDGKTLDTSGLAEHTRAMTDRLAGLQARQAAS